MGQSAAGRDRYIRISQSYPEYSDADLYLATDKGFSAGWEPINRLPSTRTTRP